jgi:hypothetical protein
VGQKTVRFSDLSGQLITEDDALARIVVHDHPELGDSPVEIEALTDEARTIEKAALRVAIVELHLPGEEEPRRVVVDAEVFDGLATDTPMPELLTSARPARPARATRRASRSANGTTGSTGTTGSAGTSGTSGIDGTGGTSGTSGTSGTDGISGTGGTSGTVVTAPVTATASDSGGRVNSDSGGRVNYASLEHAGEPHKGKTTDAEKQLVRDHFEEINDRLVAQGLRTISLTEPDHVDRYGLHDLASELAGQEALPLKELTSEPADDMLADEDETELAS